MVAINGIWVDAYLDTDATISLVSSRFVNYDDLVPNNICRVKTGEGGVTLTDSEIAGEVQVGDRKVLQKFQAFDIDVFEAVLRTDFFAENEWIKYLSLQETTHLLVVNEEKEWKAIPLKETKCRRPTLRTLNSFPLALDSEVKQERILATLRLQRTENYTLNSAAKSSHPKRTPTRSTFVLRRPTKRGGMIGESWRLGRSSMQTPFSQNTPHLGERLYGPSYGGFLYSRREELGTERNTMGAFT